MIWLNDTKRMPPPEESAAIQRLYKAVSLTREGYFYSADIVIKMFVDLDLVFFGGNLKGNVLLEWAKSGTLENNTLAVTDLRCNEKERGQCRIILNRERTLLEGLCTCEECSSPEEIWWRTPLDCIMHTLLHEMVHAYEFVMCARRKLSNDGHEEHFQTRITPVHKRALAIIGVGALEEWQGYTQHHFQIEGPDCDRDRQNKKRGLALFRRRARADEHRCRGGDGQEAHRKPGCVVM